MDSPYEVLGIDEDADEAEVVRAYRRRVKETHPDQGGSVEAFQRVQAAYEAIQGDGEPDAVPTTGGRDRATGPAERAGNGDGTAPGEGQSRADRYARERAKGTGETPEQRAYRRSQGTRVEYLDYEAIADAGKELTDEDLFEWAADAGLDVEAYGRLYVAPGETLLEAAEERGFSWPFACRGGACANCAVAVLNGELEMPANHVLDEELLDHGIRLSCIGEPVGQELQVVFNLAHLPGLDDLRLPPQQFGGSSG